MAHIISKVYAVSHAAGVEDTVPIYHIDNVREAGKASERFYELGSDNAKETRLV